MIIRLEGDKLTEEIKFKPYIGVPDIERLLRDTLPMNMESINN